VKIVLGAIGRLKEPYLVAAEDEYKKRLKRYCELSIVEAKQEPAILALPGHLYALDERGDTITSAELADLIGREALHGGGAPVVFAVGGPDGHSDALRARAVRLLAFGRMTIAHRLVRILLLEQIYRSFTILRGEPYHRDQ
jgi:23S rRNA (pseudouridine1915-N3)-methyltransferase